MSLGILRVKSIYEECYLETFTDRVTELHVVPDVVAVGNRVWWLYIGTYAVQDT